MAEKLANALERGWHFRRAGHSTVRRIMDSGARGCQVIIAGKLTGARHRTEKFKEGHIKYCGEAKLNFMHQGFAIAKLKPGVTGVTVQIMDPNARLPDEIDIIPPPAAPAEPAAKPEAEVKAEEAKVAAAVEELKKTAATAQGAPPKEAPKPKRARKKKEGEAAEGAAAPGTPGEEKKPLRKRKKKEEQPAPAQPASQEAIVLAPVQAITPTEEKKPESTDEKKEG